MRGSFILQRWPGHVKARHFVLALRDYFRQQMEDKKRRLQVGEQISRVNVQDEWAVEYITINRLQAIAEAFDDDGSGFITIAEVNQFTSSRPKDWRYVSTSSISIVIGSCADLPPVCPIGLRTGLLVSAPVEYDPCTQC